MGKKFKSANQVQVIRNSQWFQHYFNYLTSMAYQLFEWEGLPDSVDPRYLEMMIHQQGSVGFYKHKELGYIVSTGALSGMVDHYNLPTQFHVSNARFQDSFKVLNYKDMVNEKGKWGVVIYNNDYHNSSLPSLEMFAEDLAELKEVIYVNQNAQKTPVLITANDLNKLSILNVYKQYTGNQPVILTHENFNTDSIKVFKTDAPYVVDKLNQQKDSIWNEVMTYLGINNTNLQKKERMITSEADSNGEQIKASANIFLKSREEACDKINALYPDLELSVKLRHEIVEQMQQNVSRETNGGDPANG